MMSAHLRRSQRTDTRKLYCYELRKSGEKDDERRKEEERGASLPAEGVILFFSDSVRSIKTWGEQSGHSFFLSFPVPEGRNRRVMLEGTFSDYGKRGRGGTGLVRGVTDLRS